MKSDATRIYHMSDADLALFASNLVVTMTRDQTEFAAKEAASCFVATPFTLT